MGDLAPTSEEEREADAAAPLSKWPLATDRKTTPARTGPRAGRTQQYCTVRIESAPVWGARAGEKRP